MRVHLSGQVDLHLHCPVRADAAYGEHQAAAAGSTAGIATSGRGHREAPVSAAPATCCPGGWTRWVATACSSARCTRSSACAPVPLPADREGAQAVPRAGRADGVGRRVLADPAGPAVEVEHAGCGETVHAWLGFAVPQRRCIHPRCALRPVPVSLVMFDLLAARGSDLRVGRYRAEGAASSACTPAAVRVRRRYFLPVFFLPATVFFGPLRVRAFVLVRWPRTGRPRRCRIPW
jgi:hypothetical protein